MSELPATPPPLPQRSMSSSDNSSGEQSANDGRMRILWWGWLTLLLLGPLVIYLRIKHAPPQPVSYYGGLAFGMLMFPLLGAWIGWRVSGRRTYLPATIIFCVIAVLASLGQVNVIRQHQQVEELAEVMADLMREVETRSQRYDEAKNRLSEAGGIDVPSMKSPDDIAQRLKLVRQFGAANEAFDTSLSGLDENAQVRLQSAGATDAEVDEILRSVRQNMPLAREVRRIDRDLIRAMEDLLIVLKSTWGAWRVDAGSGELLFDNDAEVTRCTQLFEQIEKLRLEHRHIQMQVDAQERAG